MNLHRVRQHRTIEEKQATVNSSHDRHSHGFVRQVLERDGDKKKQERRCALNGADGA